MLIFGTTCVTSRVISLNYDRAVCRLMRQEGNSVFYGRFISPNQELTVTVYRECVDPQAVRVITGIFMIINGNNCENNLARVTGHRV